jgi:hypothetical protein
MLKAFEARAHNGMQLDCVDETCCGLVVLRAAKVLVVDFLPF